MILGELGNWTKEKYIYAPALRRALAYLQQSDFSAMDFGKYSLEGERMFVLVQEAVTESKQQRRAESHRKFIDIQLLIEGEEKIGVARWTPELEPVEDRLEQDDLAFYNEVGKESDILLTPGMFAVFFPTDIHRPCCCITEGRRIRKAVVKIDIQLLEQVG